MSSFPHFEEATPFPRSSERVNLRKSRIINPNEKAKKRFILEKKSILKCSHYFQ
jgi:hypothetical protein